MQQGILVAERERYTRIYAEKRRIWEATRAPSRGVKARRPHGGWVRPRATMKSGESDKIH
jgi:hypothetical protein